MNQKTMWEADEIAQARHRIILRVYILPTHPLFPWGFFFFIKYDPKAGTGIALVCFPSLSITS